MSRQPMFKVAAVSVEVVMQLSHYLGLLHCAEIDLAAALRDVADGHRDEADVHHLARKLARQCDRHAELLGPFVERYGEDAPDEPDRLYSEIFRGTREGGLGCCETCTTSTS